MFHLDFSSIDFNKHNFIRTTLEHLRNLLESLYKENLSLKSQLQQLKDEINRLKGQKGKPDIKANSSDENSKPDKHKFIQPKKRWKKRSKLDKVKIDDTKVVKYEGVLPLDAEHKGYRSIVVQDIAINTNNIEYKLERYYSPSQGKTYEASVPDYINGEFGATLKSWVLFWCFNSRMSEQKIYQMLTDTGISISQGQISNIIIKNQDKFHKEKIETVSAGIKSTSYQHIDDTGARVNGVNQYFTVLCNDYYSAFFIRAKKDRLTVIDILSQEEELSYLINSYALTFLKERNLKSSVISALSSFLQMPAMHQDSFEKELTHLIPELKNRQKTLILEAAAIAAYQEKHSSAVIEKIVSDDAKQFHDITRLRALCWIHEERHYQKLTPLFLHHQELLADFRSQIWEYYYELTQYKKNPNEKDKERLSASFDEIFSTQTGYDELDKRIRLTRAKKDHLLVVLTYPEIPLHNNTAELALRSYIIKRKISFGTRTDEGTQSWETFFTIMDTSRKLGVNFRDYLYDRISELYKMPSLASLIISEPP